MEHSLQSLILAHTVLHILAPAMFALSASSSSNAEAIFYCSSSNAGTIFYSTSSPSPINKITKYGRVHKFWGEEQKITGTTKIKHKAR